MGVRPLVSVADASDDPRTDQSSRVTVDELMELEVGELQRSRGGVAHESHSLCRCRRLPFRRVVATHNRRARLAAVRMSPHSSEPASRPVAVPHPFPIV